MSSHNGRIAIVGVAESDYGRVPNMTEMEMHPLDRKSVV